MNKKLLNISKNLIIILVTILIVMNTLTISVFADPASTGGAASPTANQNFSTQFKKAISGWYMIIRNVCLVVMLIGFVIMLIKLLADRTPETSSIIKKSIKDWIISLSLVMLLHYIMIAIMQLNQILINESVGLGARLSGLNSKDISEYVLYEAALSKAYEIAIVPGFIGLIMYILLVYYTIKFVIFYVKRYINVIMLILLGPIVCTVSSFKKTMTGITGGMIGKWFKEFIFNVFIQALHAVFYATIIGITIKLSLDEQNYAAAILTMILFGAIFQIDKVLRKLFNFVGGSTAVSTLSSSADEVEQSLKKLKKSALKAMNSAESKVNTLANQSFKKNVAMIKNDAKNAGLKLKNTYVDANKVKVSAKEIVEEEEKMKENKGFEKVRSLAQGAATGLGTGIAFGITKGLDKTLKAIKEKYNKKVTDLRNDKEIIKRIPFIINAATRRKMPKMYMLPELKEVYATTIDVDKKPNALVDEIKDGIQYANSDIVSVVYMSVGVQAFLYSKIGSPRMGMAMLAESNYDNQAIREMNSETINQENRISLGSHVSANRSTAISKKYSFNRFSFNATKKIVKKLERKAIANTSYLHVINNVSNMLSSGKLGYRGAVQVNNVELVYKAKAHASNVRKHSSVLKLEAFKNRQEDGKWAQISSKLVESHLATNTSRSNMLRKDNKSQDQIRISNMVKTGDAYEISDNISLVRKEENTSSSMQTSDVSSQSTLQTAIRTSNVKYDIDISNASQAVEAKLDENAAFLKQITDYAIVNSAIQVQEYDLRQLDFTTNSEAREIAINGLISSGVVDKSITNNAETMKELIESLNARAEEISVQHEDKVLETIAANEYANIVRSSIEQGEVTPENVQDIDLDAKMQKLSETIINAAKKQLDIVGGAIDVNVDEFIKAYNEEKAKAKEERELEKARKELEKGKTKTNNKSEEENKEDEEEPLEKVTLNFYGAIEGGYASISLTNKHKLKDFYFMAKPIEGQSDLYKTEQYFNEKYGPRLNVPFYYFKNNAQASMDGWEIYVASRTEDITTGDKEKDEETEKQAMALIERFKNNMPEIRKVFEKFIEDNDITSFDEIIDDSKLKNDLVYKLAWNNKIRKEHFSIDEISDFVNTMEEYSELRNIVKDRLATVLAKRRVIEQKDKFVIERTESKSDNSKEASEENVSEEADKTIIVDASSIKVIQELFEKLNANKVLVGVQTEQQKARRNLYMDILGNYEE